MDDATYVQVVEEILDEDFARERWEREQRTAPRPDPDPQREAEAEAWLEWFLNPEPLPPELQRRFDQSDREWMSLIRRTAVELGWLALPRIAPPPPKRRPSRLVQKCSRLVTLPQVRGPPRPMLVLENVRN